MRQTKVLRPILMPLLLFSLASCTSTKRTPITYDAYHNGSKLHGDYQRTTSFLRTELTCRKLVSPDYPAIVLHSYWVNKYRYEYDAGYFINKHLDKLFDDCMAAHGYTYKNVREVK